MASLKNVKLKIISVKKTSTVTRAMEAVSAVKMRKSQERAMMARPFARAALRILSGLSSSIEAQNHPLTREKREGKTAIILITSDKGLAGSLNSAVLKKTEQFISEESLGKDDLVFLCVGRRGYEFAERRGYEIIEHYTNVSDDVDEEQFRAITKSVINVQLSGITKEVRVIYTNFHSTFEQKAAAHKILPLSQKILEHVVADILPDKGKYSESRTEVKKIGSYTIEPHGEEGMVLDALLPKLVNITVFHKMLESKASEHSARMVAMKNATDKAKERAQELTRTFNKVRQAAITREVSEITSGIEAMR